MGAFAWLFGGSKSAAKVRAEKRGLRLYDPDQILTRRETKSEPQTSPAAGGSGGGGGRRTIDDEQWYDLISSNVDRIRYHMPTQELQVVFKKKGDCYQYENVEPSIFQAFLRTHSPGQFVWYVLRQYGYSYRKIGGGFSTSAPAPGHFDEQPFAVSPEIEGVQRRAGRKPTNGGLWNFGTPTAKGAGGPHEAFDNSFF